jgi:hypothetical protein
MRVGRATPEAIENAIVDDQHSASHAGFAVHRHLRAHVLQPERLLGFIVRNRERTRDSVVVGVASKHAATDDVYV